MVTPSHRPSRRRSVALVGALLALGFTALLPRPGRVPPPAPAPTPTAPAAPAEAPRPPAREYVHLVLRRDPEHVPPGHRSFWFNPRYHPGPAVYNALRARELLGMPSLSIGMAMTGYHPDADITTMAIAAAQAQRDPTDLAARDAFERLYADNLDRWPERREDIEANAAWVHPGPPETTLAHLRAVLDRACAEGRTGEDLRTVMDRMVALDVVGPRTEADAERFACIADLAPDDLAIAGFGLQLASRYLPDHAAAWAARVEATDTHDEADRFARGIGASARTRALMRRQIEPATWEEAFVVAATPCLPDARHEARALARNVPDGWEFSRVDPYDPDLSACLQQLDLPPAPAPVHVGLLVFKG